MQEISEEERLAVEVFKVQRLIKKLRSAHGNGTSMITISIPAGDQLSLVTHKLVTEAGAASNIKSRTNRQSVQDAITSCQHRLRHYNQTPKNGLVLFAGYCVFDESTGDGKERKFVEAIEPFKPVQRGMYFCGSQFDTTPLEDLVADDSCYGFIIMDGKCALFAKLIGSQYQIIQKVNVDLPKKHRRGGQSSVRFARLRCEARANYVRRASEIATEVFISDDKCNVRGIVVAGSADFKTVLTESALFDPRLQTRIVTIVDISYGAEAGLRQAIQMSQDALGDVKFMQERKVLKIFFHQIAMDTGMYVFGLRDVLNVMESGVAERVIIWDNYDVLRVVLKDADGTEYVKYGAPHEVIKPDFLVHTTEEGRKIALEIVDKDPYVEWIASNYGNYGCALDIVSDRSPEGTQFTTGFGGIGAVLRYRFDANDLNDDNEANSDFDSDLDDFM